MSDEENNDNDNQKNGSSSSSSASSSDATSSDSDSESESRSDSDRSNTPGSSSDESSETPKVAAIDQNKSSDAISVSEKQHKKVESPPYGKERSSEAERSREEQSSPEGQRSFEVPQQSPEEQSSSDEQPSPEEQSPEKQHSSQEQHSPEEKQSPQEEQASSEEQLPGKQHSSEEQHSPEEKQSPQEEQPSSKEQSPEEKQSTEEQSSSEEQPSSPVKVVEVKIDQRKIIHDKEKVSEKQLVEVVDTEKSNRIDKIPTTENKTGENVRNESNKSKVDQTPENQNKKDTERRRRRTRSRSKSRTRRHRSRSNSRDRYHRKTTEYSKNRRRSRSRSPYNSHHHYDKNDRHTSSTMKSDDRDQLDKNTINKSDKSADTRVDKLDPKDKPSENPEVITRKQQRTVDLLTSRTGGAYIPPAKLRLLQAEITDKTSAAYQRIAWEALKKSIHGYINKVNVDNIGIITRELIKENIIRGRGLLSRSIIQAQTASPTFTHVYAALVSVINSKFPNIGELLLKRLIIQFKRGFRRNDKIVCMSSSRFIAHLINQRVCHEIIALEILTLLVETPTDDSVEVAIGFLKECGMKLTEVSSKGINAIFEMLKNILHEGKLDIRVQYMIEVIFQVRKDGFKDHIAVMESLELVEEDDQFTHLVTLDDVTDAEDVLNVFKFDAEYESNEDKYKGLCKELLGSDDSDDGSGDGSGDSDDDDDDEDEEDEEAKNEKQQLIIDQTETNLVALRRTIYLTIHSSLDYEECAHKLMKMQLKPGQEMELCHMFLDCCAEQRTYEKFYGLLAQRFCMINKIYIPPFEEIFRDTYTTTHRLDTNRLRNVSKFFAHLLFTDAIGWDVMECIRLNEEDTTSSSRIFIKILFQELAEYMGLGKLNGRLKDPTIQLSFSGLFPRDNPRNTRFAINFFTSIGLGGLTDELREHLKNAPKLMTPIVTETKVIKVDTSSSGSSSSDSSSSSSSGSSSNSSGSSDSDSSSDSSSESNDSSSSNSSKELSKSKKIKKHKKSDDAKKNKKKKQRKLNDNNLKDSHKKMDDKELHNKKDNESHAGSKSTPHTENESKNIVDKKSDDKKGDDKNDRSSKRYDDRYDKDRDRKNYSKHSSNNSEQDSDRRRYRERDRDTERDDRRDKYKSSRSDVNRDYADHRHRGKRNSNEDDNNNNNNNNNNKDRKRQRDNSRSEHSDGKRNKRSCDDDDDGDNYKKKNNDDKSKKRHEKKSKRNVSSERG